MKILALESSAVTASVALCEGETLIVQSFQHTGLTHSQTLLPMVEAALRDCGWSLSEIGLIGVAAGPGSFTGLRIGVSVAKGLAFAQDIPCVACSTLESMAWNAVAVQGELCAAMDARRGQIYNARFSSDGGRLMRLTEDRALSLEVLSEELCNHREPQFILGDGAGLCYEALTEKGIPTRLSAPNLRFQQAWGVARCALEAYQRGDAVPGDQIAPVYLRLSQAERERLKK